MEDVFRISRKLVASKLFYKVIVIVMYYDICYVTIIGEKVIDCGKLPIEYTMVYRFLQILKIQKVPPNVPKSLFAIMTSSPSPRRKSYFCQSSMKYKRIPSDRQYYVRKLHHIVSFVRYLGQRPCLFKHSTAVAILTTTQEKSIVFTNANTLYPSIDC